MLQKKVPIRNGGMLQWSDAEAQISGSFFVHILLSAILVWFSLLLLKIAREASS